MYAGMAFVHTGMACMHRAGQSQSLYGSNRSACSDLFQREQERIEQCGLFWIECLYACVYVCMHVVYVTPATGY